MTVFAFDDDPHVATIACAHVLEGAPILYVSHDEDDGMWQFLCGRDDHAEDEARVVGLLHMVEHDPSLNELAKMCEGHHATRPAAGSPWEEHDPTEQRIRDSIASTGWHVLGIQGDGDAPAFAYTVGLFERFKHPELLIYGLPHETMHSLLNSIGERIRAGEKFGDRARIAGVLGGKLDLAARAVKDRQSYRDHFGYALWFYGGDWFPVLQMVWPDRANRFPWDGGFDETMRALQPLIE